MVPARGRAEGGAIYSGPHPPAPAGDPARGRVEVQAGARSIPTPPGKGRGEGGRGLHAPACGQPTPEAGQRSRGTRSSRGPPMPPGGHLRPHSHPPAYGRSIGGKRYPQSHIPNRFARGPVAELLGRSGVSMRRT